MRLEIKLGVGTGVFMGAMLMALLGTQYWVSQSQQRIRTLAEERLPAILAVEDSRVPMQRSLKASAQSLMLGNPAQIQPLRAERLEETHHAAEALGRLDTLEAMSGNREFATSLTRLHTLFAGMTQAQSDMEQVQALRTSGAVVRAHEIFQTQLLPEYRSFEDQAAALLASQSGEAQSDLMQLHQQGIRTLETMWLLTLIGACLGGTLTALLTRQFSRAIDALVTRANSIAEGDLTGQDLPIISEDQVGMLGQAMNRMQHSLAGIIGTVVDTAGSLTGSAVSMRTASDGIHRRIDEQSQQTQQAATAMQEMSASIAEVSRHTHSAAETAREAARTAREGGKIVKQMLSTMQDVESGVQETSRMVGLLGEDSHRISQIVTTIDEIARKTNLLALNAAIEAARAGDHGRGFAVVAGEVRRLAESTAQATGEIASMISGIQDRTGTAIATMEHGTSSVKDGLVTTSAAGEALERIIGMAEQVDRMITQIAIAASQQAAAADQSSSSLDFIHTLSHDNLMEMATTAAGIESLRGTAVKLEKQVDRFHLSTARNHTDGVSSFALQTA